VTYQFDSAAQGWTAIDVPSAELCNAPGAGGLLPSSWSAAGGHPGGCFFFREGGNTAIDPLLRTPASIGGNYAAAAGGYIRFDRRSPNNNVGYSDDIYMQGIVGGQTVTLISNTKNIPYARWQANRVPLTAGEWTVGRCAGPIATQNEIAAVLAGLTEIKLKAEYVNGVEDHFIDNVMILRPDAVAVTNFEADAGGWTVAGDSSSFGWVAAEGANIVRCFKVVDAAAGRGMSFVAPASFLGDKSATIGTTLEFDLASNVGIGGAQPDTGGGFVALRSVNKTLFFRNTNLPIVGGPWRHHAVPLVPSPSWTRSTDGVPATSADFAQVMSALTALLIRAEFRNGGETNFLDSVVLGTGSPSVTADPSASLVCAGNLVTLTATVAGAAPFTYQWLRNGVAINPAVNSSAVTAQLVVNATAVSDGGGFACIVSNDRGSVTSNEATLTVITCGPARCNAADIANDTGQPIHNFTIAPDPLVPNNGITEADYNVFFANFFDAINVTDIADDQGIPLPPFGTGGIAPNVNNGVTEGDYNLFFSIFFDGCSF